MITLALFTALAAFAGEKTDYTLCNEGKGRGGAVEHFFDIGAKGTLEFNRKHPRALLISQNPAKGELKFFEFAEKGDPEAGLSFGGGEESVARTEVKLNAARIGPESLEIRRVWKKASQLAVNAKPESAGWEKLKKELPKRKEFGGRETSDWVKFAYSQNRCYVRQEGSVWQGKRLVSFDFDLCEQILRLTDRKSSDLRKSWLGENAGDKEEARRILQLIRGAIVKVDERLKGRGLQLMAAGVITPEHALPGALPEEESSALRELKECEARLDAKKLPAVERGHETMDELTPPSP